MPKGTYVLLVFTYWDQAIHFVSHKHLAARSSEIQLGPTDEFQLKLRIY